MQKSFHTGRALLLAAARAVSLIGFVVATALLSRSLALNEYGTFRQCWTIYAIAVPVASTGIAQSLFYFVPLNGERGHWPLVRRSLRIAAGIGFALVIVSVTGASAISGAFNNSGGSLAFAAFGVFLGASVPIALSDGVFMSVGRTGTAALFNLLNRTTLLVGLAIPVALLRVDFTDGLLVLGGLQVVALALFLVLARRAHATPTQGREPAPVLGADQWKYVAPIMGATVFGALYMQFDKFIVGAFASPSEFAVYANGAFENPVVALVVAASSATVAAELVKLRANRNVTGFAELWGAMTERVSAALIPMGAFLFVFAQEAVVLLFSARYADSAAVFRLYVLLTPVRIVAFSTVFASLNRNIAYLIGHVLAGLLLVLAGPLLLRQVGITGPAIALVITSYGLGAGFLYVIAKDIGVAFGRVLPYRRIVELAVLSTLAAWGARTVAVSLLGQEATAAVVVGGVLFAAAVGAVLLGQNAIRKRVPRSAGQMGARLS